MKSLFLFLILLSAVNLSAQKSKIKATYGTPLYTWEKQQAKAIETGDLQWQPEEFKYTPGPTIRYIDYQGGNDNSDGKSPSTAWKHHPWDDEATAVAKESKGSITYVFKRGVVYRGILHATESGETNNPIRLTSDPSWGSGEACIYGSMRITSGWKKADAQLAPRIPQADKVWYCDLGETIPDTKVVCELASNELKRVRLARTPNYRYSMPDPEAYWPVWTKKETTDKNFLWLSDSLNITQEDPHYYDGATVWSEQDAIVMCTVWAQKVKAYDPVKHRIAVQEKSFGGRKCPYFIENLPSLLDTTGEFYYDNKIKRLYLRLDKDKDPNTTTIEVATKGKLITAEGKHDIVISGLTFGFTTSDVTRQGDGDAVAVLDFSGTCSNIEVSHNKFTYVNAAFLVKNPITPELRSHDFLVSDNDMYVVDDQAIAFSRGGNSFFDKVKIMRNRIYDNGGRHLCRWYSSVPAIIGSFIDAEVAGNIIDISWGNGIDCFWGKNGNDKETSLPFIRGLVHHNKASHTLLGCNDYGGIESWQGGPVYYYDNISYDAAGYRHYNQSSIGYAFYFDGGFKQYCFNNIASGLSWNRNRSGFMTVLGFYNMTVNNTVYRIESFSHGAVDDADSGGHNFYLANLGDSVKFMFKTSMKPEQVPFESIGYNVASKTPFKADIVTDPKLKKAFWGDNNIVELDAYKKKLEPFQPQLANVGVNATQAVLPQASSFNYKPSKGSEAIDKGVKFFAPFPLYANVGEWHFYKHPADSSVIMAENFYMTNEYKSRNSYYRIANNNLKAHGLTLKNFVKGALEDWTEGALQFDGKQTYCNLNDSVTSTKICTNVNMDTNNFLIEVYFKTDKQNPNGVLVSKSDLSGNGYKLDAGPDGKPRLSLIINGKTAFVLSGKEKVNDGKWHHLLAEVDRAKTANIYIDGKMSNGATKGNYPNASVSLANSTDLLVGKDIQGNFFKGTLDFLRISKGTLDEARTSIGELYKWELDGPFLRDFTGKLPLGKGRDAGAIEVQ